MRIELWLSCQEMHFWGHFPLFLKLKGFLPKKVSYLPAEYDKNENCEMLSA